MEACDGIDNNCVGQIDEGFPRNIYYFDSDIFFYGNLSSLESEMQQMEILLTPHYLHLYPDDGHAPNDLTLLRGGVFNAGFLGVRTTRNTRDFLSWWKEMILTMACVVTKNGLIWCQYCFLR